MSTKKLFALSLGSAALLAFAISSPVHATTLVPQTLSGIVNCGTNSLIVDGEVTKSTAGTNITGEWPATNLEITGEVLKGNSKYKAAEGKSQVVQVSFFGANGSGVREMYPPPLGSKGTFVITGEGSKGLSSICGGTIQGYFKKLEVSGQEPVYQNGLGNRGLQLQQTATTLQTYVTQRSAAGTQVANSVKGLASINKLQTLKDGDAIPAATFRDTIQMMINKNAESASTPQ